MAIFKGAGVAIVTPMFENGEVTYSFPHNNLPGYL